MVVEVVLEVMVGVVVRVVALPDKMYHSGVPACWQVCKVDGKIAMWWPC